MKTATIPATRVNPALRQAVEDNLQEGETLSNFLVESLQLNLNRRKAEQAFLAKGMASREQARSTGEYVSSDEVLDGLKQKLAAAKQKAG
ncbi:MAG: prevent-host-death protein [Algicola sp.]|nr:prevent-host-death protein [Algicola sp.]